MARAHSRFLESAAWSLCALACAVAAQADTTLTGFASLPANTFAAGSPPAGGFSEEGRKLATARFEAQPVQGVSAIAPVVIKDKKARKLPTGRGGQVVDSTPTEWWALSDNGFGTRANSGDYRLALYRVRVQPARAPEKPQRRLRARPVKSTPTVTLLQRIELRDPDRYFPWPLALSANTERVLTGADADPESLVLMEDGSFWVGEEHGPWLLHFSADGRLLEAPVEFVPGGTVLRSAAHPDVVNSGKTARLAASKGFEGLAPGERTGTLLAALEAPIKDDLTADVRLFEYDLRIRGWSGREWRYPLDSTEHSVAEIVRDPFGPSDSYLVIERDGSQGPAAQFKKIFRIRLSTLPTKTLAVDLLAINDPLRLANSTGKFRFPFLTTEALWPTAKGELVVVNDNNFPAPGGRSSVSPDPTEWIFLRE